MVLIQVTKKRQLLICFTVKFVEVICEMTENHNNCTQKTYKRR